ncbi:MAG: ABC-F family ATP-binding cassette domain-containing protein [Clostridia bacterium]|nr:ABC-F family ATP-binding cassette domain-containing protein [Clostridia bacterium]
MLTIENLTHGFGDRVLYKDVNIKINKGDKIGLVGVNGSGKSTLINILNGTLICDKGNVWWEKKFKVGYLDQHAQINPEITVFDYLKLAFKDIYEKEAEYNKINEKFATAQPEEYEELAHKAEVLFEYLDRNDYYSIESTIKKISSGLGVADLGYDTLIKKLSGGQRAKVILSKLLLEKPDLIILDEPTNFLDTAHIEWLTTYLKELNGTFLIVSHDTTFLDNVCNVIWSVEYCKIERYVGNYSHFVNQKQEKTNLTEKLIAKQNEKINKLEEYIAKNKCRTATAKQAKSREKQLAKIERIEKPEEPPMPNYHFLCEPLSANIILKIQNLSVGYYYPILKNINLFVQNGEKVRISGFNGIGKSTLLKTIIGEISALSGKIDKHHLLNIGYFEQEINWVNNAITPIEEIRNNYPKLNDKQIRGCLAKSGLPSKLQMQPLSSLSGGEQTKVKLCKFILQPFNMLILDEPTNHLDVNAKKALAKAINEFSGAVIFVSHEEDFVKLIKHNELDLSKNLK